MSNITVAFIVVIMLNVFMMLSNQAIININPSNQFFNSEGSLIDTYNITSRTGDQNLTGGLPGGGSGVTTESGDLFTDIFGTMLGFVKKSDLFIKIFSAPYNYLTLMNLPAVFVTILGTAWYLITLVLLILVLFGRHN